jgi:hypothetical protein
MTDEERRRVRAAEIAEYLDVSEKEFAEWLAGKQGEDWPQPEGTDDEGQYWGVDDIAAWNTWYEAG